MFSGLQDKLLEIGRDAWTFLAVITGMVALLGGLFYILKGTAGAALGSDRTAAMAIAGAIGVVLLVLVGFLLIPELGTMIQSAQPTPPF